MFGGPLISLVFGFNNRSPSRGCLCQDLTCSVRFRQSPCKASMTYSVPVMELARGETRNPVHDVPLPARLGKELGHRR
jgi:hypothetical protein